MSEEADGGRGRVVSEGSLGRTLIEGNERIFAHLFICTSVLLRVKMGADVFDVP